MMNEWASESANRSWFEDSKGSRDAVRSMDDSLKSYVLGDVIDLAAFLALS